MRPKSFFLFMLALWAGISTSGAYTVKVDGIYYDIGGNGQNAAVTYKSDGYHSSYSAYSGGVVIPSTFTYNGKTYSVTSIGEKAFYQSSGLTSVTIPNSVRSIGKDAFQDCGGMTSINIPSSVTSIGDNAFFNCSGLTSIYIPYSVTSIGNNAFQNCGGLTSVRINDLKAWCNITFSNDRANPLFFAHHLFINGTEVTDLVIPESVTSLPFGTFWGCSSLTSVTIPNSVTSIGKSSFYGCNGLTSIVIPNSVTSIGAYAFSKCSGLTSVTIPNSVRSIGDNAFFSCSGLTSITIPNSVISIGQSSFKGCLFEIDKFINNTSMSDSNFFGAIILDTEPSDGLLIIGNSVIKCRPWVTSVTIPENVTTIFDNAFSGCYNLTSITIPNSVTSIGNNSFENCSSLTSVTIPNSVSSIGKYAFWNCSSLTTVTIPESVTSIGECAFYQCSGLTSVTIPNSVTSFGSGAFYCCRDLTSVTFHCTNIDTWFSGLTTIKEVIIGDEVTSIGPSAFSDCSGLTSVIIPESVTSIGQNAFSGCSGLTSVTIPNSVTSIGQNAFSGCFFAIDMFINNTTLSDRNYWGATIIGIEQSDGLLISDNSVIKCRPWATSVTIPESVTEIVEEAFWGCGGLTSVTFHCAKIKARLSGFKSIKEVIIGDEVTSIDEKAFTGCSSLTSVTIGNSVTSIGKDAFLNCSGLTSVHINDLKAWYNIGFGNSYSNPLYYAHHLFVNDAEVTDIVIPESVTSIRQSTFSGCSGLISVTIPESVTTISNTAFEGCVYISALKWESKVNPNVVTQYCKRNLRAVTLSGNVSSVASQVFKDCSSLYSVTIGAKIASIADDAFENAKPVKAIWLTNTPPEGYANVGATINYVANDQYGFDTQVVLSSISSIFEVEGSKYVPISLAERTCALIDYPCVAKTDIYVGKKTSYRGIEMTVAQILPYVFYRFPFAEKVTVDIEGEIGARAFEECSKMDSVIIGGGLTAIGEWAFSGCTSIKYINSLVLVPPVCGSNALDDINKWECTLYVPVGYVDAYRAADQWRDFLFVEEGELVTVPVTGITLNIEGATLSVNQTVALEVIVLPETATDKSVTWTSSDEAVAVVDGEGVVTGKKAGTATITVTSVANPDLTATCEITVMQPVESVTLDVASIVLEEIGATYQLTATVLPEDASDKAVTWASSDEKVCTVSAEGHVTAVGAGTATVTVTTVDGGKTATCEVTVVIPVTEIALSVETLELSVGESKKLDATVSPENASDKSLEWSSSDETIAAVDGEGNVKALKAGTATITVTSVSYPNIAASCEITVIQPVESVTLDMASIVLEEIGATYHLTATVLPEDASEKAVTWASSDEAVCTVSAEGLVTAVGAGTATITVTTVDGGKTATCEVTVVIPVTEIALSNDTLQMQVGDKRQLAATVSPENASDKSLEWSSSNEAVAKVDANGQVEAVAAGTALITVKSVAYPEVMAICDVTVIEDNGIMMLQVGEMLHVRAIYDVTGRKLERLQQGMNILLLKDGTSRKIRIE